MAVRAPVSRAALAVRLRIVNGRLHRRLRTSVDEGLGQTKHSALATVARVGSIGPSELAEMEHVSRPTMTNIVAALEDAGLVVRNGDPADGRRARVTATDAGRRLLERMRRRKAAYLARRLRELSDDEVRTLDEAAGIMERLLEGGR